MTRFGTKESSAVPPSEAQRRAHAKHEAAREKRVAVWVDEETAALLDKKRKKLSRGEFIKRLIKVSDKLRGLLKGALDE